MPAPMKMRKVPNVRALHAFQRQLVVTLPLTAWMLHCLLACDLRGNNDLPLSTLSLGELFSTFAPIEMHRYIIRYNIIV